MTRQNNYRAIFRGTYDYPVFVRANDIVEAREIAQKTYGGCHKLISLEKYNFWEV